MLAHALGRQLAHPSGLGGWLVGHAMRLANRRPTRLAVDALEIAPGDCVLDLGCGPGDAVSWIAATTKAREVHGIDASQMMIRQAEARNVRRLRKGRVAFRCGDFRALPYANAQFDRLLASNVLYFWHDAPAIFAEARRVLRPGGRIAVYVTEAEAMRRWPFATTGTHRLFDRAGLIHTFTESGFPVEQVHVVRAEITRRIHGLIATAQT
jgi:ubiquinone/menaquinone biosynthesis C-methylase UbiE